MRMEEAFFVSSDKQLLDIKVIHDYISNRSYWGQGRSLASVKTSIDESLCFGIYTSTNQQVGFARVITDKTVLAYLLDVFILEPYRGKGLGKQLIQTILDYEGLESVSWLLSTKDARGLYEQFGFVENTRRHMKRPAGLMTNLSAAQE